MTNAPRSTRARSSSVRPGNRSTPVIAVYEWNAWEHFMIRRLFPTATRIEATPLDAPERVAALVPPQCRMLVFHLNCTLTKDFLENREQLLQLLAADGIRVLNAQVTDISKRKLHEACRTLGLNSTLTSANGRPNDQVIVKTQLNYGGASERQLSAEQRHLLALPDRAIPLPCLEDYPSEYPVLARQDVPLDWWRDPQLCIEDFIQNSADRIYRVWLLRDRISVADAICPGLIKKFPHSSQRSFSHLRLDADGSVIGLLRPELPFLDDVLALRRHFALDYGAIDVVQNDDGRCFIIDINTTPSAVAPFYDSVVQHLRAFSV